MRPVTLNLGGVKDPAVVSALIQVQSASQDTLQSDSSSPGGAMSSVPFPTDGSFAANTIAYFSQVTPTILMAFTALTAFGRTLIGLANAAGLISALGIRTVLTTATTFYVATNGSDSNNGLTSGAPFLTLAHAMSVITGQYDFGGQTVTLQANAGHAAFTTKLVVSPWVGGGSFIYDGGGGSLTYAGVSGVEKIVDVTQGTIPGIFTIQNVTISGTIGTAQQIIGIAVFGSSTVIIGVGITFGSITSPSIHMQARDAGQFFIMNSYTISGSADYHYNVAVFGIFTNNSAIITITISANLTFIDFILCGTGLLNFNTNIPTFSLGGHTVTGQSYNVKNNGIVNTGNSGVNYFPGNTSPRGVTSLGGQYS
jgi:hypothetical protein